LLIQTKLSQKKFQQSPSFNVLPRDDLLH
jgi:hypothetical protein